MDKILIGHIKFRNALFHKLKLNIVFGFVLLNLSPETYAQGNFYTRISLPIQNSGIYVKSVNPGFSPSKFTLYTHGSGMADSSIVLIKTTQTGQVSSALEVYGQPLGFASNQLATIQFTSDSLLTANFATLTTPLILKFDTTLALLSAKSFPFQPIYMNRLIEIDGNLFGVGGTHYQSIPSGAICRMDLQGNVISSHVFYNGDSARRASFQSACKSTDGGFLFAGEHSYMNAATPVKMMLVKTDSLMNVIWQHHYCLDTLVTSGYGLMTTSILELPGNGFMLLVNNSVNANSGFLVIDNSGNVNSYTTFRYGSGSMSRKPFLFGLDYLPDSTIITAGEIDIGTSPYNLPVALKIDTTASLLDVKFGNITNTNLNFVTDARYNPDNGLLFSFSRILGVVCEIETLQTDSLLTFPCGSNNFPLQNVSYTLFDSIFNYNFVPITRSTSNVTSQLHTTPVNTSQTIYCQTSLSDEVDQPLIQCYPNPANDHFMLRLSNWTGKAGSMKITDIRGKELSMMILNDNKTEWLISTSNLANGIYLVEVRVDGNTPALFKMVVNH